MIEHLKNINPDKVSSDTRPLLMKKKYYNNNTWEIRGENPPHIEYKLGLNNPKPITKNIFI